jgi:hypothetical protein
VITTAIATTKIPELFRVHQGFWYVVSDARTDFAMCGCLFFLILSGGKWSLDAKLLDEPHLEESRDAKGGFSTMFKPWQGAH